MGKHLQRFNMSTVFCWCRQQCIKTPSASNPCHRTVVFWLPTWATRVQFFVEQLKAYLGGFSSKNVFVEQETVRDGDDTMQVRKLACMHFASPKTISPLQGSQACRWQSKIEKHSLLLQPICQSTTIVPPSIWHNFHTPKRSTKMAQMYTRCTKYIQLFTFTRSQQSRRGSRPFGDSENCTRVELPLSEAKGGIVDLQGVWRDGVSKYRSLRFSKYRLSDWIDWDSSLAFHFFERFSPLGQRILAASTLLDGVWALQFRKLFCFGGSGRFRFLQCFNFPLLRSFQSRRSHIVHPFSGLKSNIRRKLNAKDANNCRASFGSWETMLSQLED